MLVQRVFCRSWQPTMRSLHHAVSPNRTIFRTLRTSARNSNSASHSLQPASGSGQGPVPHGNVLKALVFTGAFTGGCFIGATVMEYENTRNMMLKRAREGKFPWYKREEGGQNYWQQLQQDVRYYWEKLNAGQRIFVPICALNLLVFGMWRVPSLRSTMMKYFCSNPAARAVCWPMFLSTFSHYSTFHIFANMYVLHSFANTAVWSLGKEQFLAVYLSGGVIASLSSILYKAMTAQAGLSIGASGAIMAVLAYVCSRYPDTQLSILFLPMLQFSAGAAIKVIMGIDLAGCVMGWKFFDHAAHLGGALFGIFWAYYGHEMWQKRLAFLSMYHDWRRTK